GSSAAMLAAPTLADALRAAHPDAVIVSLSLKDRGAIMAGGAHPTASIRYDKGAGRFVTSTAFAKALPSSAPASPLPHEAGTVVDAAWVTAHAATPDPQAGEGGLGGMGIVFPHAMTGIEAPANAFRASPFADEALLTMALAALDAEKAGEHPALLALSLS